MNETPKRMRRLTLSPIKHGELLQLLTEHKALARETGEIAREVGENLQKVSRALDSLKSQLLISTPKVKIN
jgi:predicted transcriptional regulator